MVESSRKSGIGRGKISRNINKSWSNSDGRVIPQMRDWSRENFKKYQ